MSIVDNYSITNHGIDYPDYFQGCGVAFSEYTKVNTGIGDTPSEALDDCLEMIAQSGDVDVENLEKRIRENNEWLPDTPSAHDTVLEELGFDIDSPEGEDIETPWFYVSIRYTLETP